MDATTSQLSPGGDGRIRTDDRGFADPCLSHLATSPQRPPKSPRLLGPMERKTGFEPAALSLARRCSTAEPLPHHSPIADRKSLIAHRYNQGATISDQRYAIGEECRGAESNCGHRDFQSRALPTELPRRPSSLIILYHLLYLVKCIR